MNEFTGIGEIWRNVPTRCWSPGKVFMILAMYDSRYAEVIAFLPLYTTWQLSQLVNRSFFKLWSEIAGVSSFRLMKTGEIETYRLPNCYFNCINYAITGQVYLSTFKQTVDLEDCLRRRCLLMHRKSGFGLVFS